jgi:hypothetical protein
MSPQVAEAEAVALLSILMSLPKVLFLLLWALAALAELVVQTTVLQAAQVALVLTALLLAALAAMPYRQAVMIPPMVEIAELVQAEI